MSVNKSKEQCFRAVPGVHGIGKSGAAISRGGARLVRRDSFVIARPLDEFAPAWDE
jgi:hypothetical protein